MITKIIVAYPHELNDEMKQLFTLGFKGLVAKGRAAY